jgi:hypothetical protein
MVADIVMRENQLVALARLLDIAHHSEKVQRINQLQLH